MIKSKTIIIGGDLTGGGGEKWIRRFYEVNKDNLNIDIVLFGEPKERIFKEIYLYPYQKKFKKRIIPTLYSFFHYVKSEKNQNWILASGLFNIITVWIIRFFGRPNRIIVRETNLPIYYNPRLKHLYKLLNFSDSVVAQSEEMRDQLIKVGVNRSKILIISNPVEVRPPKPIKKSIPLKPRLGYIGRYTHQKGTDRILKAINEGRLTNFSKLSFFGKGDIKIHSTNNIFDLGWQSKIDFEDFDILLFPSRWEGMPNIIIEAISHYKPIIAYKWEGGFYELKDYHNISLLQQGWKGNIDLTIKKIVKNYDSAKLMASREKLFKNFNQ